MAKSDIKTKREIAKIGMSVSLGLVCLTALNTKNKTSAKIHTISGIALAGFCIYHANLYSPKSYKKDKILGSEVNAKA